jgi:hypothetical protein
MKKIKPRKPSRRRSPKPSDADIRRAKAINARDAIRSMEHTLDVMLRSAFLPPTFGLGWAESSRGECWECGVPRVRRWAGRWMEYGSQPFETPYDICRTQPLCARCAVRRGDKEYRVPRWRPRNWRSLAEYTQPPQKPVPPSPAARFAPPLANNHRSAQLSGVDHHAPSG